MADEKKNIIVGLSKVGWRRRVVYFNQTVQEKNEIPKVFGRNGKSV